ncbi:MAG: acyl-CoA-binding protein [Thermoflexales bacterium]|nr:acyl-CoA-binding protein [Thermoflexales bacterium]
MSRQAFSGVDAAWLRMEDSTNLMMITGVLVLGTPVDFELLKLSFEHRLVRRFERFRQRAVEPLLAVGPPYWEDDPDLDLNYHIQRAVLSPPGDQAALRELVSLLMSTPLDFSRPLWQIHLVERYEAGCALVIRLHHCLADGMALLHVMRSLADAPPAESGRPRLGRQRALGSQAARLAGALVREGFETLAKPSHGLELAQVGIDGLSSAGRLLLLKPDPPTIFKGQLGVSKRAAWSTPVLLADVRATARAVGATVNDVMLATVTGSLRRYLLDHGQAVDGLDFRAIVPVSLRAPGAEVELGNKFSLFFLSLPIGVDERLERLALVKQRMDALKGSHEAIITFGALNVLGLTPPTIHDAIVDAFGARATVVATNVPGPRKKLYLAGAPIDSMMFWVPQSGRLGLGVCILSYAGQVWVGVATDEGLAPDPDAIVAAFQAEFDALFELVRSARPAGSRPEQSGHAGTPVLAELDRTLRRLEELLNADEEKAKPAPAKLQASFEAAARRAKQLTRRPSDQTLLKLYALYKQASLGDAPPATSASSNVIDRLKRNAWARLAGTPQDKAMVDYIALVQDLEAREEL